MKKQRFSSKLLAFLMAILILAVSLPTYAFATLIDTADDDNAEEQMSSAAEEISFPKSEVYVLEEDTALRTENTKHFKLSDGTVKAVSYAQPVHYMDEDGNLIDIDNALILNGNEYIAKNKQEIKFANKSGSTGLISIKDGEYKIDFTPLNANKVSVEIENPQENNSRKFDDVKKLNNLVSYATYKNIYDGIDLEYVLVGNNIKENIIVKEKQSEYTYSFEIKLSKLNAELINNAIILTDYDTGEQVYEIPAPYMLDASGEYSSDVEYTLTQNGKWKYTLTVTANPEWINDEERQLPVKIDPTLNAGTAVKDLFVMEDGVYDNLESLIVGNFMGVYYDASGFIKFDTLAEISPTTILMNAKLLLHISYVENYTGKELKVGVYNAIGNWYTKNTDSGTYNINPDNISEYYDSNNPSPSEQTITESGVYAWDITDLYKGWVNEKEDEQIENHGICVKGIGLPSADDTTVSNHVASIRISTILNDNNHMIPTLEIEYRYLVGVEEYYAYAENTLGDTGKSYVNLFDGSLTYINNLTSISVGENLTYDINMVYNSIEKKWTPSFSENIKPFNGIGVEQYIWTDEDGTKHLFTPYLERIWFGVYVAYEFSQSGDITAVNDPKIFYPEDNINYVLIQTENDELILRDYQGNQKMFDNQGRLSRICDAQGNLLYFEYSSNNLITIKKKTVNNIISNQIRLSYDLNNRLCYIYDTKFQNYIDIEYVVAEITEEEQYLNEIIFRHGSERIDDYIHNTDGTLLEAQTISIKPFEGQLAFFNDKLTYYYNGNKLAAVEQTHKYSSTQDDNTIFSERIWQDTSIEYELNGTYYIDEAKTGKEYYVFDSKGRNIEIYFCSDNPNDEKMLIKTIPHNDNLLPDTAYYNITYSSRIALDLFDSIEDYNIVSHDITLDALEFINFESSTLEQNSELYSYDVDLDGQNVSTTAIIGPNDSVIVENTTQYPYSSICYIVCEYKAIKDNKTDEIGTIITKGTGFLIDGNILMTAAHLLYSDVTVKEDIDDFDDGINNPRFPNKITVYPGTYIDSQNNQVNPYGSYEVETCYIQKEYYTANSADYDWAACVLKNSVAVEGGYLNLAVADTNTFVNKNIEIVGYPRGDIMQMHTSTGAVLQNAGLGFLHNADTLDRNSGSPVFAENSANAVYGIHIAGMARSNINANAGIYINTFIFSFTDYLKTNE